MLAALPAAGPVSPTQIESQQHLHAGVCLSPLTQARFKCIVHEIACHVSACLQSACIICLPLFLPEGHLQDACLV
ncbi:hypothetical protein DUNSADRAFT_14904 [Dunaliella salina]|uniref:Encoded protein n=1 Tax=Dunaliella salina TaxID=3046 RepID=A0ABQ7G6G5_DUNSA|nr:hypothetical protein DUNSADRAFT_14904 [Dunaliella salina]|eukprot:KAF5830197.1 hypothetical protein DUNSADRAFT_14904 [Dunaliella salina]